MCFRETIMLVNVCKALAYGLLAPWIPPPPKEDKSEGSPASMEVVDKISHGKILKVVPPPNKAKVSGVIISPDAGPDVKKAVEVVYAG